MSDDKLNWAGASVGFSEADLRGGDETADESVAAELADLLPRLPRVKITPQTITQPIIDRWYGYETEYRQTIAELRAELAERHAADNENIGIETRPLTKRELRDIGMAVVGPLKYVPERWDHETVARLYWALMQQRGEAIMARRELAELRERIGETPGLGGYTIGCDGDDATQWPYVECNRCRHDVWTGRYAGSALNLADAVDQVAAHNCDKAAKLRNIITEGG